MKTREQEATKGLDFENQVIRQLQRVFGPVRVNVQRGAKRADAEFTVGDKIYPIEIKVKLTRWSAEAVLNTWLHEPNVGALILVAREVEPSVSAVAESAARLGRKQLLILDEIALGRLGDVLEEYPEKKYSILAQVLLSSGVVTRTKIDDWAARTGPERGSLKTLMSKLAQDNTLAYGMFLDLPANLFHRAARILFGQRIPPASKEKAIQYPASKLNTESMEEIVRRYWYAAQNKALVVSVSVDNRELSSLMRLGFPAKEDKLDEQRPYAQELDQYLDTLYGRVFFEGETRLGYQNGRIGLFKILQGALIMLPLLSGFPRDVIILRAPTVKITKQLKSRVKGVVGIRSIALPEDTNRVSEILKEISPKLGNPVTSIKQNALTGEVREIRIRPVEHRRLVVALQPKPLRMTFAGHDEESQLNHVLTKLLKLLAIYFTAY